MLTEVDGLPVAEGPDHPQLADRGRHRLARGGAAQDLPAAAAGQPGPAGEGPGTVQGEVPRPEPLPARPGRPVPHQPEVRPDVPETEMTLRAVDFVNAIKYLLDLRAGKGGVDDIDHLGNRRLRTIDELAADELRKGFLKLRRTVQERMAIKDAEDMTPADAHQPEERVGGHRVLLRPVANCSQVVDQTNPLAQLTHERRLSALGPGGLNRKRAGFEVRDVHISHYGRICPIETPGGDEHRADLVAVASSPRSTSTGSSSPRTGRSTTEADRRGGQAAGRRGDAGSSSPRPTRRRRPRQDLRRPGERPVRRRPDEHPVEKVRLPRRVAEADGRGVGRADPVPRARRRQPGAHGLEHAAAGGAAAGARTAARRHRVWRRKWPSTPGCSSRAQEDGTVVYVDAERIKIEEKDKIVREYVAAEVPRAERADVPEPEADRQDRARRSRRARSWPTGRPPTSGELALGPERPGRVHVVGGVQLRGRDHHLASGW